MVGGGQEGGEGYGMVGVGGFFWTITIPKMASKLVVHTFPKVCWQPGRKENKVG